MYYNKNKSQQPFKSKLPEITSFYYILIVIHIQQKITFKVVCIKSNEMSNKCKQYQMTSLTKQNFIQNTID